MKEMRRVLKGDPSCPDRLPPLAISPELRRMLDAFWDHATRIPIPSGYVRMCQSLWSYWKLSLISSLSVAVAVAVADGVGPFADLETRFFKGRFATGPSLK